MEQHSRPLILVVDDTEADLDLMVETLSSEYEVAVATNGPDALEQARELQPHLVMLDIMLPGMDGYAVLEQLHAAPETRDIPVVFVSSKSNLEDEALGFAMGAVDYVTKPISPPRVRARVASHLDLYDARKRLEEQNQELLQAAKLHQDVEMIMRHDLKTPLNGIVGLPQVLLMDPGLTQEQRIILEQIEGAGRKMLEQINNSLVLFRIEQGSYHLEPGPVDLARLVRRVFRYLSRQPGKTGQRLELLVDGLEAPEDLSLLVSGEELLLESMLCNLVKNATEAAPEEGVISVNLVRFGSRVAMHVTNPGEVPEEIREHFFDKYSTAGKIRGTGLGTYSARLMAELHGGDIAFTTGLELGTTVTVNLPLPE